MGMVKRAFLYVTRKKGKSILLFCVLIIMATFVLSGLSIEKATRAEQESLRKSLGGFFTLSPDYSENNPYGDDIVIAIKDNNKTPAGQENSQGIENSEIKSSSDVDRISVTVSVFNMLQLYLIGFAIITLSVVVSSGSVMRLKPKEILSKMS